MHQCLLSTLLCVLLTPLNTPQPLLQIKVAKELRKSSRIDESQADVIHNLLADCMETSLRQMLLSGEVNSQMVGKVIDYLKHNNIKVVSEANTPLSSLADLVAQIDIDNL